MSHDVVADALNKIMNAKRAGKTSLEVTGRSKLLLSVLALAKLREYIKDYKIVGKQLKIEIGNLNKCNSIKPRFTVKVEQIKKYEKRYLPARDMGILIISTPKGLMANDTALEKNLGGCLIAYMY